MDLFSHFSQPYCIFFMILHTFRPFLQSDNEYISFHSGELFAQAPVDEYPGVAVETVSDSSRYFVLRIMDDNGG